MSSGDEGLSVRGSTVNVGKQPYEQVTVFLLDRPDAVAQPTVE
ncbi:MAG: hypothetical protein WBW53_12700 [Terriglobales bacterium]